MTLGKMEQGLLYSDEDIKNMLLNGIIVNLAYENYGEELFKDAEEHLKFLDAYEMRRICSIKIQQPEKHLLDIIDNIKKEKAYDGD